MLHYIPHSCLFKAPPSLNTQSALIGQLTYAWASTATNNKAAVLNQLFCAKLAARHKLNCKCKSVTLWHSEMSQSRVIKGRTTDEASQEQFFFRGETGASVGADSDSFNCNI